MFLELDSDSLKNKSASCECPNVMEAQYYIAVVLHSFAHLLQPIIHLAQILSGKKGGNQKEGLEGKLGRGAELYKSGGGGESGQEQNEMERMKSLYRRLEGNER